MHLYFEDRCLTEPAQLTQFVKSYKDAKVIDGCKVKQSGVKMPLERTLQFHESYIGLPVNRRVDLILTQCLLYKNTLARLMSGWY
jgi:hypothetical protein